MLELWKLHCVQAAREPGHTGSFAALFAEQNPHVQDGMGECDQRGGTLQQDQFALCR